MHVFASYYDDVTGVCVFVWAREPHFDSCLAEGADAEHRVPLCRTGRTHRGVASLVDGFRPLNASLCSLCYFSALCS